MGIDTQKSILHRILESGFTLYPQSKSFFIELEKKCPDLSKNLDRGMVIANKYKDLRNQNPETCRKILKSMRGCVWFKDPITNEIIFKDNDWLSPAITPNIWVTFCGTFPVLTPYILTGSFTKIVGIYIENKSKLNFLEAYFQDNNDSIYNHRILCVDDYYYLIFYEEELHPAGYRENHNEIINGECFYFIGYADLIPINNAIIFKEPEPIIVKLWKNDDGAVSPTPVPKYLVPKFFN